MKDDSPKKATGKQECRRSAGNQKTAKEALARIVDVLEPLADQERLRVLKSAAILLGVNYQ